MANEFVAGKVVNKVVWDIDKKSWDNLEKFENKLDSLKKKMSKMDGSTSPFSKLKPIKRSQTYSRKEQDARVTAFRKNTEEVAKKQQKIQETIAVKMARAESSMLGVKHAGKFRPELQSDLTRINELFRKGSVSVKEYNQQVDSTVKKYKVLSRETRTVGQKMRGLRRDVMNLTAAYTAFAGLQNLAQTGFKFEQTESMLEGVLGSTEAAAKEMQFLRKVSREMGTDLEQTAKGYAQLSSATKETSITQAQARELFVATSKSAAAFGLSSDEASGMMKALIQTVNKGQAMSEELKSQFGERMPGALNIAAKAWGTDVKGFLKQMELGNVDAERFIPLLAKEMDAFATPAFLANAEKANFAFKRMSAEFTLFKESIFKAGLDDVFKNTFETLRRGLIAVRPIMNWFVETFSFTFTLATAPLKLMVALLADIANFLDIKLDTGVGTLVTGFIAVTLATAAWVWQLRLALSVMRGIAALLGLKALAGFAKKGIGKMMGGRTPPASGGKGGPGGKGNIWSNWSSVLEKNTADATKKGLVKGGTVAAGIIGKRLIGLLAGPVGWAWLAYDIINAVGLPDKPIPASNLSQSDVIDRAKNAMNPSGGRSKEVNVNIGVQDSKLSEFIKVEVRNQDQELLNNTGR